MELLPLYRVAEITSRDSRHISLSVIVYHFCKELFFWILFYHNEDNIFNCMKLYYHSYNVITIGTDQLM